MTLIGISRCLRFWEDPPELTAFFIPFELPDAVVGVPYYAVAGGAYGDPPYTFALTAGPAWATIDADTGVISGTPDVTGAGITITVQVTDDSAAVASVSDTINTTLAAALTAFFTPTLLPDAAVGVPYAAGTGASNGDPPYTFSKIAGPAWLSVVAQTGQLIGTAPSVAAGVTVTIRATDSEGAFDDVTDTINVLANAVLTAVFNPTPLPDGEVGTAYVGDTNALNGTPPYTFAKAVGPSWLTVHPSTGALGGVPPAATAGVVITVGVTDATAAYAEVSDTIAVLAEETPPVPTTQILIGGSFINVGGTFLPRVARIAQNNGAEDVTFVPSPANDVYAVCKQSNGSIVLGGLFTTVSATTRNRIARVSTTGTLDVAFNPNADAAVRVIKQRADGSLLVGGDFTTIGGGSAVAFAALSSAGALLFDADIVGSFVLDLVERPDGKILIVGSMSSVDGTARDKVAQLNADGTLDVTFVPVVMPLGGAARAVALQADGKALVGGGMVDVGVGLRNGLVRLNTDGSHDTGFAADIESGAVYSIAVQGDGKIVVGGEFTSVNGVARNKLVRLNADGTLDAAFNPVFASGALVAKVALQTNGKIVVGGTFSTVNAVTRNNIARINSDGTLDATFDPDADSDVFTVVLS